MSPERPIKWLGKKKENRALNLFSELMENILETTKSMNEVVQLFCQNSRDFSEKIERALEKEGEADEVREKIIDELSKGTYPPISRETIIRLAQATDDVADHSKIAAEKINFLDPNNVDEDLKKKLRKLSNLALDTVNLLSEAFNTFLKERDLDPLIRKAQEVEKMEEKVDDFRANEIFPNITKWADKNHKCGTVLLILEIEENIEEVVDTTEDVTDILREIGISSV